MEPTEHILNQAFVTAPLKPRPADCHKGMLGSVGIIGGATSMTGAALLAGRAALKCGAGRVYVALLADNAPAVDLLQPELMLRTPAQLFELDHLSALVIGPGLSQSSDAMNWLQRALASDLPLIIDADALNLLAAHHDLRLQLRQRTAPAILTPHPGEAARLMGYDLKAIQHDRMDTAQLLAKNFHSIIVLKGAGTICALPDRHWFINPTGNPGLSSAGMGDVLSGMIAAFIAQQLSPQQATLLAVYLHGAAADILLKQGTGPIGLTASEVIDAARQQLNIWIYSRQS
ncbi:NAD(P)H-hydrate dehydratase [Sulfuriferula thiophila]|uniref:NAD(P)H-hydrate dehydratase n=1 Tax=Sulfuriferula thiophila TaxID=1781211 RepID=UPI000F606FF4|nr:NAD(P)H-hydrate dehydratase [Sulfuriferula thiophila]